MTLQPFIDLYLPAIEQELQNMVEQADGLGLDSLYHMLAYHMGWEGEGAGPAARGKRIRPLLVLLSTSAAGGDWKSALPAAAGVELLHNFSLIHDDIEDNSPTRRSRPTLWSRWGIPQAINTGDAMFALANLSVTKLERMVSPKVTLQAARLLLETCLALTQGQYLDISYELRRDLSLEDYWPMVTGKTAALLAACTEMGALISETPEDIRQAYRQFGKSLGLAFQAQDDLLGIWGDAELTGKSAASDLVSGKKSLPVLYGLGQNGPFAQRWRQGAIPPEEVTGLAGQLKSEGGYDYTLQAAERLTQEALKALEAAQPRGEAGQALNELARMLLNRTK